MALLGGTIATAHPPASRPFLDLLDGCLVRRFDDHLFNLPPCLDQSSAPFSKAKSDNGAEILSFGSRQKTHEGKVEVVPFFPCSSCPVLSYRFVVR